MRLCPETFPIITGLVPGAASATGDTADAICLKNASGALIIAMHAGTSDNDITLTVHEGATAAEAQAGTYAITTGAEFPIWINTDVASSDALVRQTDALTYVINSDLGTNQMVVFYIPASILTNGRDWISLGHDAGHASNFFCVLYMLDGGRYQQTTPPTAIA
jgi:hypothetical protein